MDQELTQMVRSCILKANLSLHQLNKEELIWCLEEALRLSRLIEVVLPNQPAAPAVGRQISMFSEVPE